MGQLLRVGETYQGQKVVAITGSPKKRNLQRREGVVTGYDTRDIPGTNHYTVDAVVELADGEVVRTHRLMDA